MCYNFYGGDVMSFTHLYVETNYAMNGSNIKIEELVKQAVSLGYSSLAITDPKLHGVIKFYKECQKHKIKPIIGLQATIEGIKPEFKNNVLLYAKNNEGYQNLLKLASISSMNKIITLQEMKEYKKSIIAVLLTNESELITYINNAQNNEVNEFKEMVSSCFEETYVNITNQPDIDAFLQKEFKTILTPRVTYLRQEDKKVTETLRKIFNTEKDNMLGTDNEVYFTTKQEVQTHYNGYEKEISTTDFLAQKCNVTIDFSNVHLPAYKLKKGVNAKSYLEALVLAGLNKRLTGKKVNKKIYMDRLHYELSIINQMGYNDYFLIVWDFVKYAKKKGYLVGPGRGSAAASLVSYCLGITSVDSIKYGLVFERFLNPERITLPDIDMDIPDDKRDDVIKYVRDFYGVEKVASICTFGTFLSKSAIRDTSRVLQVDGILLEEIVKETNKYDSIIDMMKDSKTIINIMDQNQKAQEMLEIASKIEGLHRHVSTHAAGIIVSEENMTKYTAIQPGLLDMIQTQYEAKDLENLGLLKIDFLGLRNLTSINNIISLINKNENKKLNAYKIPLDDQLTFDLLKRVETTGIFQLESKGMRSLIGQMQIDSFEDIVTILALFRPGPMENIPSYLKRRFKQEDVTYPHPVLEQVLAPTNGIIIYQEQIIQIANLFAGYSFGEADVLRRAVSKKQTEVLQKERKHFVDKSVQQGKDIKTANQIYDYIVKFANYGFNRAHSVAYAMVSYWMAYLKANYPKYFISILTSSVIGSESQTREYIFEANKLGVKIKKPTVNYSTAIFNPDEDALLYPLLGIKNVGRNTVKALLEERKTGLFKSYIDFVSRTHKVLNKRVLESLIYAGACDEFGYSKKAMIQQLDKVIDFTLYGGFINQDEFMIERLEEFEYDILEEKEHSVLGFNLFINPLQKHEEYITKHKLIKPSEVEDKHIGTQLRMVAILNHVREITTKNNKLMAFVTLRDEYVKLDGVLFTMMYEKQKDNLVKNSVYLFKGKVERRNNTLQYVISHLHKLD